MLKQKKLCRHALCVNQGKADHLKGFDALLERLMPSWFQIRPCSIFNLAHADKSGAIPLQVRFLQLPHT